MKQNNYDQDPLEKISSGIEGFDDITAGGIPARRTTLLMGGPGCGKTVLALQILVNSALRHNTAGIFVAFEENARRVVANAERFGWNMRELEKKHLFFMDAHLSPNVVKSGAFDLTALLVSVCAAAVERGAKVIVFDALDVLLSVLADPAAERQEIYRLNDWLTQNELTVIITAKVDDHQPVAAPRYGCLPFMADCVVVLRQRAISAVTVREMRVLKYRGSPHVLNEVPFVIGSSGVEIGSSNGVHPEPQPFQERVSTGVERLDAMLGGGFYRGTNALITGSAGTGKSTLAGIFVEAACRRSERALFISFDENVRDIVRDLTSVNVQLAPYLSSGLLRMESLRSASGSAEEHLMRIKHFIHEFKPACVTVDPLSALVYVGGEMAARSAAERLIYLCRNARITALFTSLLEGSDPSLETTPLHVSTLADSWLQISYSLSGGERNRALTIIKSRGSKHSNQMRELIFRDSGISLADPYTAGGAVLMGTLRIEKERSVLAQQRRKRDEVEQKEREVELIRAERDLNLDSARRDLQCRSDDLANLVIAQETRSAEKRESKDDVIRKRDSATVTKQADGEKRSPQSPDDSSKHGGQHS